MFVLTRVYCIRSPDVRINKIILYKVPWCRINESILYIGLWWYRALTNFIPSGYKLQLEIERSPK